MPPRMMAGGRRILGTIPDVRRVFTGSAVGNDRSYRYSWLVRFCDAAVIDSYRDDPRHWDFADSRFRPHADGRISIDYQETTHGSEKS